MKTLYISLGIVILILTGGFLYLKSDYLKSDKTPEKQILSFKDCVDAGYIVLESYPRQCKTPDGRTYAEEVVQKATYNNTTESEVNVEIPYPGAVVGKDFSIIGKARGGWYFEASFPVQVLALDGRVLFEGPAQAGSDWMTENLVPFKLDIKISEKYIGPATVVLKKDNPSGDPAKDASISFPITIEY